ncbi:MAG: sigma factor [Pirellula sp.]
MTEINDRHDNIAPQFPFFESTCWNLVLTANRQYSSESDTALDWLCRTYWPPLYAYALRRASNVHEAQDLTQAFFERMLDRKYLADADPLRGRFRAFLLTAFKRFLANEWDREQAKKRGGGLHRISMEFAEFETIRFQDSLTPETIFERRWATTLLDRVMQNLQIDMQQIGKAKEFEILKHHLSGKHAAISFAESARKLGLSESATRMAASRMRKKYRHLLRNEILQTVSSAEEVDDEIQRLFAAFES